MKNLALIIPLVFLTSCNVTQEEQGKEGSKHTKENAIQSIEYKTENIDGVKVFYREAGNPDKPTIVLLHGFPSSSHQYRKVLHQLADDYHLIEPDYPRLWRKRFPKHILNV